MTFLYYIYKLGSSISECFSAFKCSSIDCCSFNCVDRYQRMRSERRRSQSADMRKKRQNARLSRGMIKQ